MKRFVFACIAGFCLAQPVKGQFPGMGRPGGQNMNLGHIYGKIIDETSSTPIEGAIIQLIQNKLDTVTRKKKDFILATLLSNKKGEFSFENLPVMSTFQLRITALGHKPVSQKVGFELNMSAAKPGDYSSMLNAVDKDLGNIKLTIDPTELQNVTVNSTKPLLTMGLDRKIYNVEKDISAAGGTALDVMKNVPTVNVDIDGNVTMRNAAPQIYIDGRPTTLALDQIPADQIASVEIISNPSAKFDASGGGAGILNIVLKRNRKTGYNGNVRAGIDSRAMPSLGGDFNFRQDKINFFGAGMYGKRKSISTASSQRAHFMDDTTTSYLSQYNNPEGNGHYGFGRIGMDYFIDNRNTITLNGNVGGGRFNNVDEMQIYIDTIQNGNTKSESAIRTMNTLAIFHNYGTSLSFKHNFAKPGKEWTIDGNFSYNENDNSADYTMQFFDGVPSPVSYQRASGGGSTRFFTAQTDFVNPITATQKIETGLRMSVRNFSNLSINYFREQDGEYVPLEGSGTHYGFNDMVYAAYVIYSKQIKDFTYQAGLRAEGSEYTGDLISESKQFKNDYPLSLFPSLFLTYKLNKKTDIQLNYSRKINRPGFFQILPFVDSSDLLNLSKGNPDLIPEFTQLVEATLSYQYGNGNSILATGYGKYTENLITRYQYQEGSTNPARDSIIYTTFGNADYGYTIGLELNGKNKLTKWWDLTSNLNLYQAAINADNLPASGNSDRFTWFAKVNNSFKLPKNFTIQLTADYQARALLPASGRSGGGGMMFFGGGGGFGQSLGTAQGYILPIYGADISVKKEFLKNNAASLTLSFNDIFRTRVYATHAETVNYTQDNKRRRDPQVVRLNFNWRFGKIDVSLFKRKNLKSEMENMQNMQQMGQ